MTYVKMLARAYGTMMISSTVVGAHLGAYHTFLSGEPYFFERILAGASYGLLAGSLFPVTLPLGAIYLIKNRSFREVFQPKGGRLA